MQTISSTKTSPTLSTTTTFDLNDTTLQLVASHDVSVGSKKTVFQLLSEIASEASGVNSYSILERMQERDKLLTSAVGDGVMLPQAEIPMIDTPVLVVTTLHAPITFEYMVDKTPIDIAALLLVPENKGTKNLRDLSRIARHLRDARMLELIRGADSSDAIISIVCMAHDGPGQNTVLRKAA